MKRIVVALALLGALAGCAPQLKSANEVGGFVSNSTGMHPVKALDLADEHCKKFGKRARISSENEWENTMAFACVTP